MSPTRKKRRGQSLDQQVDAIDRGIRAQLRRQFAARVESARTRRTIVDKEAAANMPILIAVDPNLPAVELIRRLTSAGLRLTPDSAYNWRLTLRESQR